MLDHCFADPGVRRVVVEPDVRNERIRALNAAFGFRELRTITLPTKEAALSVLDRATTSAHLTPDNLARAQRHLVTKAIAEYAHERLLAPEPDGDRLDAHDAGRRHDVLVRRDRGSRSTTGRSTRPR